MAAVTIIYKNGRSVSIECQKFKVHSTDGKLTRIECEWDESVTPRPLFIGIDEIAAIYEGKA